jgi:FimV-like protein
MLLPVTIQNALDLIIQPLVPLANYVSAHQEAQYGLLAFVALLAVLLLVVASQGHEPSPAAFASDTDINTIAGGDKVATQLDLARAYVEMDKKKMAKPILDSVLKNGNAQQKTIARRLLQSCK